MVRVIWLGLEVRVRAGLCDLQSPDEWAFLII